MMTRRGWAVGMVFAAACGGTPSSPGPAPPEDVTITFIRNNNGPYVNATDDALAEYTKSHPHVTFRDITTDYRSVVSTLLADLKRDQLSVDLVFMPPSILCSFAANLAEVPGEVLTLSEAQNSFFAAPLAGSTCQGVLKGLPVEYNLEYGGVIVNVDKYQQRFPGKIPEWATWNDFITEAAALTEYDGSGKPCANGLDLSPDWPQPAEEILYAQILQRGGSYWVNGEFKFDTQQARDALATMVRWITVDRVMFPGALIPDKNTFFLNRLAGGATGYGCNDPSRPLSVMAYAGTWALPATVGQIPDGKAHFDFFALPPMVGTEHRFVQNSGFAWAVPHSSKNQKVAWDVARTLTLVPENARRWSRIGGSLPALRVNGTAAAAANDPILARVQPLLERGQWRGDFPAAATDTIEATIMSNYFAAVSGQKTVEQALSDMQETANNAIRTSR
jgi:multiple sugar transport system substrate-binding protein